MKTIVERTIKHYPSKLEANNLKERVQKDPFMSMRKLAAQMGISYVTLWRKLHNEKGFFLYDLELEFLLKNRWIQIETEEKFSKL